MNRKMTSLKTLAIAGTAALGISVFADAPTVEGEVTGTARHVVERIQALEEIVVTSDKPRVEVVDDAAIEAILDDVEAVEADVAVGTE